MNQVKSPETVLCGGGGDQIEFPEMVLSVCGFFIVIDDSIVSYATVTGWLCTLFVA